MTTEKSIKLFLEKGYVNKIDRLTSLFLPFNSYRIASRIFSTLPTPKNLTIESKDSALPTIYSGRNSVVQKVKDQITESSIPSIKAALIHGSIGDENEISYSDFDGILIIDCQEIKNATQLLALRKLIKKTEKTFLEQDALQHHGWALLTTNDLFSYKDHLFPFEIIRQSKVIVPNHCVTIEALITSKSNQYEILLDQLCNSIISKVSHLSLLRNQYIFKNLLSEIMLLPAAFLQATDKKSFSKGESFTIIKKEFPYLDISIINWASDLRLNWQQKPIQFKTRLFHAFRNTGITITALAPSTPKEIYIQLDEKWKQRVILLCKTLLKEFNHNKA